MKPTFERNKQIEGAPLEEENILVDPTTSKFVLLNQTSSFIWERLSSPCTAESIATEVSEYYRDVTHEDALNDVRTTMEQMASEGLIVSNDDG